MKTWQQCSAKHPRNNGLRILLRGKIPFKHTPELAWWSGSSVTTWAAVGFTAGRQQCPEFAVGLVGPLRLCWPLGSSQCFPARERCAGCISCPPSSPCSLSLLWPPVFACSEAANKGKKGSFPLPKKRVKICGLRAGKPWPCHSSGLWRIINYCTSVSPRFSSWLTSIPPQISALLLVSQILREPDSGSSQLQIFWGQKPLWCASVMEYFSGLIGLVFPREKCMLLLWWA